MSLVFEEQPVHPGDGSPPVEFAVYARHPASGNDSALLAVFNSRAAANALADLLNALQRLAPVPARPAPNLTEIPEGLGWPTGPITRPQVP